jgi:glycosyltransferase involved in cell wall biosynthesis
MHLNNTESLMSVRLNEKAFDAYSVTVGITGQEARITSDNVNGDTLFDMAMLGITTHSKVPLRFASILGFGTAILSMLVALGYLIYKILFWNSFQVGQAPLGIGLFFFSSVQLIFIGIIGEYVGNIYTQVLKRPLVIEKERINFEDMANH